MLEPIQLRGDLSDPFLAGKGCALKTLTLMVPLCAVLFCANVAGAQLGSNCGDHPEILRGKSGIIWFTPEQLEKRATKQVKPVMPARVAGFHFEGFVSFKVLVDVHGDIGCIWEETGNPVCAAAANEALQYWKFKPIVVDGKPVEYVGVVKFHVRAD